MQKSTNEDSKNSYLEKVYEQYWLHARHAENQRLWFTNIYAIIVAGLFAYMATKDIEDEKKIIILFFLIILSLFGYFVTHAWNMPFVDYSRLAEKISILEWKLNDNYWHFAKAGRYKRIYPFRISAAKAFIAFYSLMLGLFAVLLLQIIKCWPDFYVSLFGIAIFLIFYLYYIFYLEKITLEKLHKEFFTEINEFKKI